MFKLDFLEVFKHVLLWQWIGAVFKNTLITYKVEEKFIFLQLYTILGNDIAKKIWKGKIKQTSKKFRGLKKYSENLQQSKILGHS